MMNIQRFHGTNVAEKDLIQRWKILKGDKVRSALRIALFEAILLYFARILVAPSWIDPSGDDRVA